jgi:PAS domain S-box-containing protein
MIWKVVVTGAILCGLTILGAWNSGQYYVVFHSLVELFSIAVAIAIFMIAWNVRQRMGNDFLLFVAIAYAAVCLLDLAHTLAYPGMGAIPGVTIDEPTQLWIAARYLQALCLLMAPLWLTRRLPWLAALIIVGLIDGLVLLSVFHPWPWLPLFPTCHLGAPGQTPFKVISEYIISGILLAALVFLWRRRGRLDQAVFAYMAAAVVATMASELAFTSYVSVKDYSNLIGHLLKVLAVYLTYRALIVAGLKRPFDVLFRDLADSERRFRMLTAATFEGIGISEQGRFVDCNDQLAQMLGYSRQELIGREVGSLVHPEDGPSILANIERGQEAHVEHRMRHKDGRWLVIEAHGQTVADQARKVRFTAFRDVTERRGAERALQQSAEELARSNKELEQFGYIVSHDLQEPLRMVTGFLGLLQAQYGPRLDAKAGEFIGFAVDGATRMSGLIQDLLEYGRVGRKGKELQPTDVGPAIAVALANLRGTIQEAGATVTQDALPTIVADPTELAQLFQNLIGNAIKFRAPGRACQVHVGAQRQGAGWVFSVRDNGIGIAPDAFDRIFVLFQRLHTRNEYAGTGIGLAICKKIVERHGGRIWVASEPGQGTTFHFTLSA